MLRYLTAIVAGKGLLTPAMLDDCKKPFGREHDKTDDRGHSHETGSDVAGEWAALVDRHLRDPTSSWSVGILGAIGEFSYDADEPTVLHLDGTCKSVVTTRGAIVVRLPADVRCIAQETIDCDSQGWSQSLEFCLTERAASLLTHHVLTEIGPDINAVTADKRDDVLFDLGLGSPYLQFCIRSGDPKLLTRLRQGTGSSIFEASNPALNAILQRSPHRVILSQLGRIEVYQAIPPVDGGHASPLGPHTHLLPGLLAVHGTQQGTMPLSIGRVPALTLYPAHPLHDPQGRPHRFDRKAHQYFQELLARYGAANYLSEKARITRAILASVSPDSFAPTSCQLAGRIALRQLPHLHDRLVGIDAWSAIFDCSANR